MISASRVDYTNRLISLVPLKCNTFTLRAINRLHAETNLPLNPTPPRITLTSVLIFFQRKTWSGGTCNKLSRSLIPFCLDCSLYVKTPTSRSAASRQGWVDVLSLITRVGFRCTVLHEMHYYGCFVTKYYIVHFYFKCI